MASPPLPATCPVIGLLVDASNVLTGNKINTVGDLRRHAYDQGFTPQDIADLTSGKKSIWDFGQVAVDPNPLTNIAARLTLDPTNLLFGLGAAGKLPSAAGMVARFLDGLGAADKAAAVTKAGQAWGIGRTVATDLSAVDWTTLGMPEFSATIAAIGRGATYAGKGYLGTSLALTGAELGLTALPDNTPISPLLEPLVDFARREQADMSISKVPLFGLMAAVKFPYHDTLSTLKTRFDIVKTGQRTETLANGATRTTFYDRFTPALITEISDKLGLKGSDAAKLKTIQDWAGGELPFRQFEERILSDMARQDAHQYNAIARPAAQTPEEILALSADSTAAIERMMRDPNYIRSLSVNRFIQTFKDFATNSRTIAGEKSLSGGLEFRYNPKAVLESWSKDLRPSVAALAQMSDKPMGVTIGIMDDMQLPVEFIQRLRGELKSVADANGGVIPKAYMDNVLRDSPQLLRDEPFRSKLGVYATRSGPDAPFDQINQLLLDAEKTAPPIQTMLAPLRDSLDRQQRVMPFKRAGTDPVRNAPAPSVQDVTVMAPSFLGSKARTVGLRATGYDDALALRGTEQAMTLREAAPVALDNAGLNVMSITDGVAYNAAKNEVGPVVMANLKSEPGVFGRAQATLAGLMQGGSKGVKGQADYGITILGEATAKLEGKALNAVEHRWSFGGNLTPAQSDALVHLEMDAGKSGVLANFNDTTGMFRLFARENSDPAVVNQIIDAISQAVPADAVGNMVRPSVLRAFVNVVANDARKGTRTLAADEVLSNVKSAVNADEALGNQYQSVINHLTAERRGTVATRPDGSFGLRRVRTPAATGSTLRDYSATVPRSVSDALTNLERVQAGTPEAAQAVDGFLGALSKVPAGDVPNILPGLRDTVILRSKTGLGPATDEAFMRAFEDYVNTGGNRGQVLFNAERDAVGDVILPHFHPSMGNLPAEELAKLADFQRNLILQSHGRYTLKSIPTGRKSMPYVFGNKAGSIWLDVFRNDTSWVSKLFRKGPLSTMAKWENNMLRSRGAYEGANAAKQEMYNLLLNEGATMAEINNYVSRLRDAANLTTFIRGKVALFRAWDALPGDVYSKIARGEEGSFGMGPLRGELNAGKGFSPEVVAKVEQKYGSFSRLVDKASSTWWRNVQDAMDAGGVRGSVGRAMERIYNTPGFGTIRHTSKVFYHIVRFISDPRWWAMNELETQQLLGLKYGTRVWGSYGRLPSKLGTLHAGGPAGAIDAMATGWFDNRTLIGPMGKAFDAQAPRSMQRFLNDLPMQDPIIKLMVDRFGLDSKKSWGQQLFDQINSFDNKGVRQTVVDEARRVLDAESYRLLDESGLLQRIWDVNQQTWNDISHTVRGNPNRSLAERITNSYWLYWPLSYQLKAGKWLYDTLTSKFFGGHTNLGGAWELSHIMAVHNQLMASDPSYAQMWDNNPETWFFASMMIPITPFDLSVSLNKTTRTAFGYLPPDVRPWQPPAAATRGTFSTIQYLSTMGPLFTSQELQRLNKEIDPIAALNEVFNPSPGGNPGQVHWGP